MKAPTSLTFLSLLLVWQQRGAYATYGNHHWDPSLQEHSASSSSQGSHNPSTQHQDTFGRVDIPLGGDGSAAGWLQQLHATSHQDPYLHHHQYGDQLGFPAEYGGESGYGMVQGGQEYLYPPYHAAAGHDFRSHFIPQQGSSAVSHLPSTDYAPTQWAAASHGTPSEQHPFSDEAAPMNDLDEEGDDDAMLYDMDHLNAMLPDDETWQRGGEQEGGPIPDEEMGTNTIDDLFIPASQGYPAWHVPPGLSEREASRAVLHEEWIRRGMSRHLNAQELAIRVTEIKISHPSLAHSLGIMASGIVRRWHNAEYSYDYQEWMTCYRTSMKVLRRAFGNKGHTPAELKKLYLDNIRSTWASHHGTLADPAQEAQELHIARAVWRDFYQRRLRARVPDHAAVSDLLRLVATYSANYKYNMSMDRFESLKYIKKYLRHIVHVPFTDIKALAKKTRSCGGGSSISGYISMPGMPPL